MIDTKEKMELTKFLLQALNMALNLDGETSYTNSFAIEITEEGFLWIPRVPCSFVIGSELYQKIYAIASSVLFPLFTLLKQNGMYLVALNTDDIHVQRAFFFPWIEGTPKRLVFSNIQNVVTKVQSDFIPLMKNYNVDLNKITHIAIAGNSGSGKSFHLVYWLYLLEPFCDLTVIDPKFDSPSRWSIKHNVSLIYPQENRNQNDFVSQVNDSLSRSVNLIYDRQRKLFENPSISFKHHVIVIDELLAISSSTNKQIRDSFFSLLNQIALLGRATSVHLLTCSQRYDHNTLPVACREQFNLMIQLGNINKKTTQFLFPDLDDAEEIVIPQGIGTGIIQTIDGVHPNNVFPFLTPTYQAEKGVL
ncbi:cell division protein FtsK [Enterococcus thailandicus]|uniref:cell division protein FtsK n=1 Tax=Enterococcus thailandicus TaxID=417368 RepID=UPI003EBDE5DD